MIDFYSGQITDILPDNIKRDPVVIAMSYAISNVIKSIVNHADKSGIYASIDILDEDILDLLAVELRSKYYGDWLSLEEKKSIIKRTLLWYCRAGTLSTVQELVDFVFQDAHIEEWFQYGADAFLFQLIVNVISQDISLDRYMDFIRALYEVKNTRSHLDKVVFKYHKETEVRSLAAGSIGNVIRVKSQVARSIDAETDTKPVSAFFMGQKILITTDKSIKEDEVYILEDDGTMQRVVDDNGSFIKIKLEKGEE